MYEYLAMVNNVVDGDTIDVTIDLGFGISQKQRVRLFGMNTPELHSQNKLERQNAICAKTFLEEQVGGQVVRLKSAKPKDKYGRYLAEVWLTDGLQAKSVNEHMIQVGLAKPWDGQGGKPT